MARLRLLLLATILGTTQLASANGDAGSPFGVLSGSTLSCTATPALAGCFVERRVLTLGDLEVAVGVDAQAAWGNASTHLAPFATLAWYPTWGSVWLEFALPDSRVPTFGRPDPIRLGFTWRIP